MKHLNIWMLLLALSATLAVSAEPLTGFRYEDATKFQIIFFGGAATTELYSILHTLPLLDAPPGEDDCKKQED